MTPEEKLAKNREYHRAWRAANREKKREYSRRAQAKYRAENREAFNESVRQWRVAHPERVLEINHKAEAKRQQDVEHERARHRQWRANNPEKDLVNSLRRRARKMSARGTCSAEQAAARIAFYGGLCAYCRKAPHEHLDHVIALARGGTNWPANLRPSCQKCNNSKKDKPVLKWMREKGLGL